MYGGVNRSLALVLHDAVEMARGRGRVLARMVVAGSASDGDGLRALLLEHGREAVELELVLAADGPRLLSLELGGRAEALDGVCNIPRRPP